MDTVAITPAQVEPAIEAGSSRTDGRDSPMMLSDIESGRSDLECEPDSGSRFTGDEEDSSGWRGRRAIQRRGSEDRDSTTAQSVANALIHPRMQRAAENLFAKMRSIDPQQKVNRIVSAPMKSLRSGAVALIKVTIAMSLCSVAWTVTFVWLLTRINEIGRVGWFLLAPTAALYLLVGLVLIYVYLSIRTLGENINIEAQRLKRIWEKVHAAEGAFWKQTELITSHVNALDRLVSRLEKPSRRAMDELADVTFEKGQSLAQKITRAVKRGNAPPSTASAASTPNVKYARAEIEEIQPGDSGSATPCCGTPGHDTPGRGSPPAPRGAMGHSRTASGGSCGGSCGSYGAGVDPTADQPPTSAEPRAAHRLPRGWRTAVDQVTNVQ